MAETIRDVVVKIRLEQLQAEIKAPDITQTIKTVEIYEKRVVETAKTVAASRKKEVDATKELAKAIADAAREEQAVGDEAAEASADVLKARQASAREAEEAGEKIVEAQAKVGDALAKSAEGAFHLAKGFALFAVSGEEDSKKLIEAIAKIEGGYQTLKGGFEIVKGGAETVRALQTATQLATAAEASRAAAMGVTTTATQGATAATVALNAASGPVGIAIMGITAAVAAAAAAYVLLKDNGEDANDALIAGLDDQISKIDEANEGLRRQIGLQTRLAEIAGEDVSARLELIDDPKQRLKFLQDEAAKFGATPQFGARAGQADYSADERAKLADLAKARGEIESRNRQGKFGTEFEREGDLFTNPIYEYEAKAKDQERLNKLREAELEIVLRVAEAAQEQDQADKANLEERVKNLQRQRREIEAIAATELKALEDKKKLLTDAEQDKDPIKLQRAQSQLGPQFDTQQEIDAAITALTTQRDADTKAVIDFLDQLRETNKAASTSMALAATEVDRLRSDLERIKSRLQGDKGG